MPICHIFVLVPIIMIAPGSQARLQRKRKAVVSSQWHLVACGACQGYPETQESEIPEESAWPASVGCTRPQPAFFPLQMPTAAQLQAPLLATAKRICAETPPALWQEAGRVCSQAQQSSPQGTSYSSILGPEAFVCMKGGGRLATINSVCNASLFFQHLHLAGLEEGREAGAARRIHVAKEGCAAGSC